MKRLQRLFWNNERLSVSDERGVTTTEYAIMLVLISLAVATVGGRAGISGAVVGVFDFVRATLAS